MAALRMIDSETLDDLGTYVTRARSLGADGAIRLQANGLQLAAYVEVLPGHGLTMSGATMGLRVMALAEPAEVDVTVSLASVLDRLAWVRTSPGAGDTLAIPPTTVRVGWAAMGPPRGGWEVVGDLSAEELRTVATQGITEITEGSPQGSGVNAVAALRQRVWGRASQTIPPLPSGAAFGAYSLGFLTEQSARVYAHGHWTRLSTATGHVLVR